MHISGKRKIIFGLGILLLLLIWMIVPKEYKVDFSADAIKIENAAPEKEERVSLCIQGIFHRALFRNDCFDGKIEINKLPGASGEMLPIMFDAHGDGYGSIVYRNGDELEFIGYIRFDRSVKEVIVCLFENGEDGRKIWGKDKGTVIAYPYSSRNELSEKLYGGE